MIRVNDFMRYTGPKNRLARREGADLGLKTPGSKTHSTSLRRLNIVPGQHGTSRRRKTTDYGIQLRAKQKLKRIFGLSEKQLAIYYAKSIKAKGNTIELLIQKLENRLDNIIFRLGFSPTRAAARQLVNHGNVMVNDKKMTIPSYQGKVGDIISLSETAIKIPYIASFLEKKDLILPSWLNRQANSGKIISKINLDEFKEDVQLQLVVEFYSR